VIAVGGNVSALLRELSLEGAEPKPGSGGRRLHLLTWREISEGQRASVEHAASRITEIDDLEHALVRVFRHYDALGRVSSSISIRRCSSGFQRAGAHPVNGRRIGDTHYGLGWDRIHLAADDHSRLA
jgi:hypothetical protein